MLQRPSKYEAGPQKCCAAWHATGCWTANIHTKCWQCSRRATSRANARANASGPDHAEWHATGCWTANIHTSCWQCIWRATSRANARANASGPANRREGGATWGPNLLGGWRDGGWDHISKNGMSIYCWLIMLAMAQPATSNQQPGLANW